MIKERFNSARKLSSGEIINSSIGIQKEKILHKIIKYYISDDANNHEIKIGRMYADVYFNDTIYEIQTRQFNNLRNKLEKFLEDYKVVIVYPTSRNKTIHTITELGEFIKTTKSPKKGTPLELFVELYKISSYLLHPNLSFKILYLDMEEYRTVVPKKHYKSQGYIKYMQMPLELIEEYNLKNKEDYISLLKEYDLLVPFTTTDFSKKTKISYNKSTQAIRALAKLGIIEIVGKNGRKNLWNVKIV